MDERQAFLDWFDTTWRAAEVALHAGDAAPRHRTWSTVAPVTLFGAWRTATDPDAVHEVFEVLAASFSGARSSAVEVLVADVSADLAYTVHREVTSTVVDRAPRDYVLRVTQVYRREGGEWKVVHRHADEERGPADGR